MPRIVAIGLRELELIDACEAVSAIYLCHHITFALRITTSPGSLGLPLTLILPQ